MDSSRPKDVKASLNKPSQFFYKEEFSYRHRNPYHDKLQIFDSFVLRDNEGEENSSKWNEKYFKNNNPIEIEIGSGYGHFMLAYTENNPDKNFIGMDYRFKRSFSLAKKLKLHPHQNFCYLRARGERVEFLFGENEVSTIYYFFPDPWPKQRHHKKRLFQAPFLKAAQKVLKTGGKIILKTDHDEYFEWMVKKFHEYNDQNQFTLEFQSYDLHQSEDAPVVLTKYKTKFEKIFLAKNIKIKAMVLKCN